MIIIIFLLISVLFFSPVSEAVSIPVGGEVPDFTLGSAEGESFSLSENKGQSVVILYWRTGQKRSLLAVKEANDILKEFRKKDIKIISIIAGSDEKDEAEKTLKENEIEYPLFVDYDRQLYSDYGIRVYPTTIIIDKEGKLSHVIPSHPLTYKKFLKAHIQKALGEIDEEGLKEATSVKKEVQDKSTLEALRLYNLALKFTQSGMHDLAISTLDKSVEAKPEMLKLHILLGFLYLETKETEKALDAFNRALELDPESKDAKTGLGGALVSNGDADNAIAILDEAALANPYPQMAYYELGKAYELKGDKEKSIEMYKKAIKKIIKKNILPSAISKCQ
jgi:tetratricopeptide (TPR) repeat protein